MGKYDDMHLNSARPAGLNDWLNAHWSLVVPTGAVIILAILYFLGAWLQGLIAHGIPMN